MFYPHIFNHFWILEPVKFYAASPVPNTGGAITVLVLLATSDIYGETSMLKYS